MKGRNTKVKSCPKCGGDLRWDNKEALYECTSCDLRITEKGRKTLLVGKDKIKEHVKWWFSKERN